MKIIVTGGAGFIGSNIVDAYIKNGHRVAIIDDMSHGFKANLHPQAKFYKADIRKLSAVRKIINKEKPDVINHHAAIAEVVKSVIDPIPTLEVNVQGTVNLLQTGGEISIKKFIFASTGGAIYGDVKQYPIAETVTPQPPSPYGLSKLLAEQCIEYYARLNKFSYLTFRYPNVYGPKQDPKGEAGVVAIFTEIFKKNRTPNIFGDGTKTRDYVYIDDIVKANVIGLRKGKNKILNLGTGKEITDQMVYETIKAHFPKAKNAKYKTVRAGEVMRSCLNAKKAKRLLNWKPQYTFKTGVARYIEETIHD